jgi:hypothetical protein
MQVDPCGAVKHLAGIKVRGFEIGPEFVDSSILEGGDLLE